MSAFLGRRLGQEELDRGEYLSIDEHTNVCERVDDASFERRPGLVKDYVVGGTEIHLHFIIRFGEKRHPLCVAFAGLRYLHRSVRKGAREIWVPLGVRECNTDSCGYQIQSPVFVPITEFLQEGQGVVVGINGWYSVKRLQLLEDCTRLWGRPSKLLANQIGGIPPTSPSIPMDVLGQRVEAVNRKLRAADVLLARTKNQAADEVVETGAKVVNTVADHEREIGIVGHCRELEDVLSGINIVLSGDELNFTFGELPDGLIDGLEVGFRPCPLPSIVGQEATVSR